MVFMAESTPFQSAGEEKFLHMFRELEERVRGVPLLEQALSEARSQVSQLKDELRTERAHYEASAKQLTQSFEDLKNTARGIQAQNISLQQKLKLAGEAHDHIVTRFEAADHAWIGEKKNLQSQLESERTSRIYLEKQLSQARVDLSTKSRDFQGELHALISIKQSLEQEIAVRVDEHERFAKEWALERSQIFSAWEGEKSAKTSLEKQMGLLQQEVGRAKGVESLMREEQKVLRERMAHHEMRKNSDSSASVLELQSALKREQVLKVQLQATRNEVHRLKTVYPIEQLLVSKEEQIKVTREQLAALKDKPNESNDESHKIIEVFHILKAQRTQLEEMLGKAKAHISQSEAQSKDQPPSPSSDYSQIT